MGLIKTIFPCLPIGRQERRIQLPTTNAKYQPISEKATAPELSSDEAASRIVTTMLDAETPNVSFDVAIQSLVHQAGGWSEYPAKKILAALETALKGVLQGGKQMKMNNVTQDAFDKACEAAKMIGGFAADHPVATAVFCTVVALGILAILAPAVVEWLGFWVGFGEEGPITGSWAAAWQSRYAGLVPKGSLFSYFQRLGMI